ncbi:MAG TPA: hypothetical protein VF137_12345 [Candidatus Dormibacteraeota bacterium]
MVTAGIGTVAAAATSTPAARPHALPSGAQAVLAAHKPSRQKPGVVGLNVPVRPGTAAHVSPPPPAWFNLGSAPADAALAFRAGMGSALLVDPDTHAVLWYDNPTERRPTASLAKIFTVMVAMDHATSMDQQIVVPPGGEDDDITHSVMGLHAGDLITVEHLIDGIWLASGDDAAETLAEAFVPRDQFIAEMNAKAAWLGLHDTHFTNPSGLDDPGEYSSAYDLAVATGWLWNHYPAPFSLAWQPFIPLAVRGRDLSLRNLNKLVFDYNDSGHGYPGANGLKTGDTPNAGGCVAVTAQRGSKRLIAIVMNSDWFFTNAAVLLDYGFAVDH